MLEFPIDFFDDEVRDGFYVPSIMKHNWSAQMEIVHVVDEICKKNNIKYFLFSGSLIGAIRHGGFIPWDDDMDICMLRKDYMRFIKAIMRDKPERYYVRNCHTDPEYRDVFTRLMNDSDIAMAPEFYAKGHGFVCSAGIDVFPLDYIPRDPDKREEISRYLMHLSYVNKKYDDEGLTQELEGKLLAIEDTFKIKITRDETIPQQLYQLMEEILCKITRAESKGAYIALEWAQSDSMTGIPVECFKETARVPFEVTTFDVPYLYDKVLSKQFSNYMKTLRVCNIHNYPWYGNILKDLQNYNGLSDYSYKKELLPKPNRRIEWENNLKSELNKYIQLFNDASVLAEKSFENGDAASGNLLLEKCQTLAENAEAIEKKLNDSQRDHVIFFTWKAEYWKYFEPYYREEIEAGSEVLVVPMPFVRLTEERRHTAEYIEAEGFPEDVELTGFDEIDYSGVRIARTYIQYPYDDSNGATITRPFFYTENLRKYTDELIYIPWFELDEYGLDDERAMYMMRYFARIPGIVKVDKIYLRQNQSWLKDMYVYDLTQWAGEETRQIWEDKFQIVTFDFEVDGNTIMDASACEVESNENKRKTILYYIGTGQILADTEEEVRKIRSNLDVLDANGDKINVRLFIEYGMIDNINKCVPERLNDFKNLISEYEAKEWCEVINAEQPLDVNDALSIKAIMDGIDAFYGDGGILLHLAERAKKPVMMQNIRV